MEELFVQESAIATEKATKEQSATGNMQKKVKEKRLKNLKERGRKSCLFS